MAAFLNKPSDFTAKSTTQESLTLMPPSAFEKPRACRSSQPDAKLKKAAEEIETLRLENQRLRDRMASSLTQFGPTQQQQQTSTKGDSERRYADELISRQAEELAKVRSQLLKLETEHEGLETAYRQQLEQAERDREETVSALSDSLMRRDQDCQQEMLKLRKQHEGEVMDLTARLEHATSELERVKGDLGSEVTDLSAKLTSVTRQCRQTEDSLQQQLREKEEEGVKQRQQIQQLKTYMTEREEQTKPQQVWVQQCETLNNKLQIAEAEKESLASTVQLLNVRLNSVKEILLTQETELAKGKEDLTDKNKMKELLLTRWRNKVYSLLVQQKSGQMVSHKDMANWKEKVDALEEKLSSAHNSISILQHTVADREADLQLAHNTNKGLEQQMRQAERVAGCLEEQVNRDMAAVQHLASWAARCDQQFQDQSSVLQQATGQLKTLGQRVSFASSRMDVLKSQLSRREALKHLNEDKQQQQQQPEDGKSADDTSDTEQSWRLERGHVQEELSRVSAERDMLAAQLQQDSATWAEKVSSLRTQYDSEVSSLKRTVEDLEASNQEKSQLLEEVRQQLQSSQTELEEIREIRDQLGTELSRHQHTMEQALEDQRKGLEQDFTEHLAELESKLNDARREHTKAVVLLRQKERQWARDEERREEERGVTEAHYKAQIERLTHDCKTTEAERNLFMATLRQEGLLGRVRSERKEPMTLALQGEREGWGEREGEEEGEGRSSAVAAPKPSDDTTITVTETDSLQTTHNSSEAVSAVIEELKSLVPAVLDDCLDSSDDSQE